LILIIGGGVLISGGLGCIGPGVFFASILAPLPLGLWLSLNWPGRHSGAYFLIGLSIGVIGMVATLLFITAIYGGTSSAGAAWILTFLVYPVLSAVLVSGSGMYGDAIKSRADRQNTTQVITGFGGLPVAAGVLISFICTSVF